jgi:hypothetical protein
MEWHDHRRDCDPFFLSSLMTLSRFNRRQFRPSWALLVARSTTRPGGLPTTALEIYRRTHPPCRVLGGTAGRVCGTPVASTRGQRTPGLKVHARGGRRTSAGRGELTCTPTSTTRWCPSRQTPSKLFASDDSRRIRARVRPMRYHRLPTNAATLLSVPRGRDRSILRRSSVEFLA